MVGVFRGPTVEHVHHDIGLVVAVGVLEPEHSRLIHHEHAAVEELEAGRAVEFVVEHRALVGRAVLVGVLQDHELVGRCWIARLPLRVARHRRDPEAALRIEGQLHGLGELRKLRLVGEQLHLEAGGHRAGLDQVVGREDRRPTLLVLAVGLPGYTKPGIRNDQFTRGGVVGRAGDGLALGDVPDAAVADRRHAADLRVLAREGFRVERATATVHIPAVDHPVVLHVHP